MTKASVLFDKHFVVGGVDPRMKGSFVEHLGRCLYDGLYEPGHPTAAAAGFRGDVKALIRELGVTQIRYPGGNFVSGYDWKDGVGPKADRPAKKDMAWNAIETNQVGTNEFAAYLEELGIELVLAANLGTGTPKEAGELVDYCNGAGGTYWSDLRKRHGVEKPHGIELWCLGNEMDGAWQINAHTAWEYARKAKEAAKIMRWMDPSIKTIACGTCTNEVNHSTFGEWDRVVLEEMYDQIDYMSLHRYYNYRPGKQLFYPMDEDLTDIPFIFRDLEDYLGTILAACDFVKGRQRRQKDIHISFDEWGVVTESGAIPGHTGKQEFSYANFSLLDAVVYGGLICTFLNHADRVKIACQSLLVNEGGMISTAPGGKAIRQATFFPFKDFAHLANGVALRPVATLPEKDTNHHGAHPTVTCAATYDEATGKLTVFAMNCDIEDDCDLSLSLQGFGSMQSTGGTRLYDKDKFAGNTFEQEDRIVPEQLAPVPVENGLLQTVLKKHSWNVFTFDVK